MAGTRLNDAGWRAATSSCSYVETTLDPTRFARIHRSYLLNLDFLSRVELDERENRVAVLTDGRKLPVSRSGYAKLSELL